jgi:hypothetical protein
MWPEEVVEVACSGRLLESQENMRGQRGAL